MACVLIVAELRDGKIYKGSLAAVTAGRQIAEANNLDLEAVVLGSGVGAFGSQLARHGVKKVHVADSDVLANYLAESWGQVVTSVAQATGATWIGAASTVQGRDYMPRVAAALGAGMATNVVAVNGSTLTRPMWADAVLADVEITTDIKCFTVRDTEFEPAAEGDAGETADVAVEVDLATLGTEFSSLELVKSERPSMGDASIVVSGGRGTKGDFAPIENLADLLGGAIGASRAVVDAGWMPNEYQIGQTGKVIAPDLYIAAGISGAIQHLAGMKGSKVIVAINKDAEAPIFSVADYGLVADLFKAIPEFIEEYDRTKDA